MFVDNYGYVAGEEDMIFVQNIITFSRSWDIGTGNTGVDWHHDVLLPWRQDQEDEELSETSINCQNLSTI